MSGPGNRSCAQWSATPRSVAGDQRAGWGFFGTCRSFSSPCQRASLVVVCRPPPPPRCGAEQGTKKSNVPFHGCLRSLQVWEEAKKAFVPGQVVFFRILEGLWQDSCTSRKNPISHAPGFFWGLGGLAQNTVGPVQGLHKASARTFAVCSRTKKAHQKPCQGQSPSFFIQVLKKAFWGEGQNITPLQGFFPRPAGIFLSLSGSARAKTRAGGNVQNSSQSTGP